MIISKFNKFVTSKNNTKYVYNSISNSLLNISAEIFSFLNTNSQQKNIELPEKFFDKETIETLQKAKVLTLSDQDEIDKIHLKMLMSRFDKTKMNLTIAPTQACNFDCTYCYEEFRPNINMNEQTEEKIVQFIINSKPKNLFITWYGGEPLIKFDSIKRISQALIDNNINFNSSIITNGYLLSKSIIEQIDKLRIIKIQITLDGYERNHNSRRFLVNGKPSYRTILNNIKSLLSSNSSENTLLNIRVNLDKSNYEHYIDYRRHLLSILKQYNRRVQIYPGWVTGKTNPKLTCLTQPEISKFLLNNSSSYYPDNNFVECMARHINSYLIGPTGEIYKCWHNLGNSEFSLGNINKDEPTIDERLLSRFVIGTDPYLHQECQQCSILPICWGGCPMERYENRYNNFNHNTCNKYKDNITAFLTKHINKKED